MFLQQPLARLGAEVVGIDAVEKSIEIAKEHAKKDSRIEPNLRLASNQTNKKGFKVVVIFQLSAFNY